MEFEKYNKKKKLTFPSGFLWGTATSAYQTEGNNYNSDWWEWEKGKTKDGSSSKKSCDHYHRYKEDIDLMKQLKLNSYRFGIEWSRIEPNRGDYHNDEVEHYRKVLEELKINNIKSIVTLHHFTNPIWLADIGGWENENVVDYFADFSKKIVSTLGYLIDYIITINEPMVYIQYHYLVGDRPPQKKSFRSAIKVYRNFIKAHKKSYQEIKKISPNIQVSLAKNNIYFEPDNKNSYLDKWITEKINSLWNFKMLNVLKNYLDFIGLNYYFHDRIKFLPRLKFPYLFKIKNVDKETSDLGWEIYPEGIYRVIKDLSRYGKAIIICENGIADKLDRQRSKFIHDHLFYIWKAISEGADVRGYQYWSLMDNFEWESGFEPRFGLVSVNFENLVRTIRPSANYYSKIADNNTLIDYE